MQTSQIRDDWAGTFAICDPWACLLPFWVPHFPLPASPLSASDRHVPPPLWMGWHVVGGEGGSVQLVSAERKGGPPAWCRAGGGGLSSAQEVSAAAAERIPGSPLPFPGRTGRQQHLLKLWSLALLPPGAIWKALLRKPWALPKELRGAGLGLGFGAFLLGRT